MVRRARLFRRWTDAFDTGLFNTREGAFASNAFYRYWNMIGVKDAAQWGRRRVNTIEQRCQSVRIDHVKGLPVPLPDARVDSHIGYGGEWFCDRGDDGLNGDLDDQR